MARVMIVDESPDMRRSHGSILTEGGHRVVTFGSPQEALQSFYEEKPDILVTDQRLPQMSGLELARKLRIHYPNMKVIIVTAGEPGEDDAVTKAEEVVACLPKPASPEMFRQVFDKVVA